MARVPTCRGPGNLGKSIRFGPRYASRLCARRRRPPESPMRCVEPPIRATPETASERRVKEAFGDLAAHGVSIAVEFVDRIQLTKAGKMNFFVSEKDVRD